MAESKKTTTTRVTAAQVNEKVDGLVERFEGLEDAIGGIASMLAEQNAAKIIKDAANQVEAAQARPKKRASVGERDGDVIVRNLHDKMVRVRVGKETDPYRINLQPRGQKGDSVAIPASLRSDMNYKNNLGVAFEEISDQMADALRGQKRNRRLDDPETLKHRERTFTSDDEATVRRMEDQTPEDRLSRVGPQYLDVPGSNNPDNFVDESSLKAGVDAEADAEFRAFQAWRRSQAAQRQGGGSDFTEARTSGRRRDVVAESLQVSGGDELSREAQGMARYIKRLESGGRAGASDYGVIPKGELTKPVVVERATVSVQPNVTAPKRRG